EYELSVGGAPVPLAADPTAWDSGLARTLSPLRSVAEGVVLIEDTPHSRVAVPACLAAHLDDAGACATPAAQAISRSRAAADRHIALEAGATFIDPTSWVCPSDPCPPIIGRVLVYREQDHL